MADPLDTPLPASDPLTTGAQETAAAAATATPSAAVSVPVSRRVCAPSGTGGYSVTEQEVPGSPFAVTIGHTERLISRDEAAPGVATIDRSRSLHFLDPAAPVRNSDVATLPDGQRALLIRVRTVGGALLADLELGAAWQAPA